MPPPFVARRDLKMRARITATRSLVYDAEAGAAGDRPSHVRTASGLAWTGDRMVVIQDDADYIGVIHEAGGVLALPLRGLSGTRLHKRGAAHLNLEAVLSARDWRGEFLLAFSSGDGPDRQTVARVRLGGGDTEMSVFETRKLYQAMAQIDGLCGGGVLDVQGAALLPRSAGGRDAVRLFHHGRGGAADADRCLDATVDVRLDALLAYLDRSKRDPEAFLGFDLAAPRHYDLDEYEGQAFHFTDAAPVPGAPGRVAFSALAQLGSERTSPVRAVALGVVELDGTARYTIVVERDGAVAERPAQGLALSSGALGYLVVEGAGDEPSTLATLEISGL